MPNSIINRAIFFEALHTNTEYPIQQRYNHFNSLLFNNGLPQIKLTWNTRKNQSGVELCKYMVTNGRHVVDENSMEIQLSKLFKRSDEAFDSILVHEMIHIYFYMNNQFKENHGPGFQSMARQFSQKLGFDVPLTDNMKDAQMVGNTSQPVCVVLLKTPDNRTVFSIVSYNAWNKFSEEYKIQAQTWLKVKRAVEVEFISINTMIWTQIAFRTPNVKRDTITRFFGFRGNQQGDAAIDDLRTNGQIVYSLKT